MLWAPKVLFKFHEHQWPARIVIFSRITEQNNVPFDPPCGQYRDATVGE